MNVSGEASDVTMTGNVTIGDAGTDTLTINAATTTTADISFGDNDKAIFGAGSDLQIYHDGSHSYIKDAGTGSLEIQSDSIIKFQKGASEYLAQFNVDGAVQLYYDNALKLATESGGVNVTGTLTSDGLTVGIGDNIGVNASNGFSVDASSNIDFTSGGVKSLRIKEGDISFYDSAGSSQSFFWDASAESLGIGTSSPSRPLHVAASDGLLARLQRTDAFTGSWDVRVGTQTTGDFTIYDNENSKRAIQIDKLSGSFTDPALKIDSVGNVKASNSVGVSGSAGMPVLQQAAGSQGFPSYSFYDDGNTGMYRVSSDALGFATAGAQRVRIDSDGLKFNGDTAAANALDDYEEGTFNLALSAGSTSNGYVISSQNCKYTKIGNICYVTGEFNFSTVPSSYDGNVAFTGLPFTSGFSNSHQIGVAREVSTSGDIFVTQVNQGSAEIGMNAMDGISSSDNQSILAGKTYSFSNTYITE